MKNKNLYTFCGFMAFTAMFISGVVGVLGLFDLNLPNFVSQIGNLMLIASVAISGFVFAMTADLPGPNIVWKIAFLIFIILSLTGTINSLI